MLQHCWTTSWGLSTRFIGAIIMVHGDDPGLDPATEACAIPGRDRFRSTRLTMKRPSCLKNAHKLRKELIGAGIRVKMDERDGMSPGFKFNDWEMRGVPLRLELGPKDVAKGSVVLARRDRPGREGKAFVPQQGIAPAVIQLLEEIQQALYRPSACLPKGKHCRAR